MHEQNLKWIFNLKNEIPNFLDRLKGKKRLDFYHYSLTGDYFNEKKWGLGNSVFSLKIIYTLGLENKYKEEIKDFMLNRLAIYKEYYYPNMGGFSFYKNRSNRSYYGAIITRGRNEPDIHGTVMFLWGISLIAQVLNINDELKFREFKT